MHNTDKQKKVQNECLKKVYRFFLLPRTVEDSFITCFSDTSKVRLELVPTVTCAASKILFKKLNILYFFLPHALNC